jgi:hypothetical protein
MQGPVVGGNCCHALKESVQVCNSHELHILTSVESLCLWPCPILFSRLGFSIFWGRLMGKAKGIEGGKGVIMKKIMQIHLEKRKWGYDEGHGK